MDRRIASLFETVRQCSLDHAWINYEKVSVDDQVGAYSSVVLAGPMLANIAHARVFLNFSCHLPFFAAGAAVSATLAVDDCGPASLCSGCHAIVDELG